MCIPGTAEFNDTSDVNQGLSPASVSMCHRIRSIAASHKSWSIGTIMLFVCGFLALSPYTLIRMVFKRFRLPSLKCRSFFAIISL